jgi:hypothetical protein
LRSKAKASNLHLALLLIGLEPGEPVKWLEGEGKWQPPKGPKVKISCEFEKEGKRVSIPAGKMLRNAKTHEAMLETAWVFVGSRQTEDGDYAADVAGYLITLVNFQVTVIDVPQVRSSKNEALEWEVNPEVAPKQGTTVWVVIEAAEKRDK